MGMRSKCLRALSVLLVLGLMIGLLPSVSLPVRAETRGLTLEELREKFPDGRYWNGGNADSWTDSPCTHHGYCGSYDGSCGCNSFLGMSTQCMGFAEKLGYDATGCNPRKNENGWYTYTSVSALNNVKPGDIIRSNGHSVYVTDVQGSTVTYADCNYNGNCNIRWGVTKDISAFKNYFSHVRSAPFALTSGYLTQCERFSSSGTVTATTETVLWTSPCTNEVYADSLQSGTLTAGEKIAVSALYRNSLGELWYKVSYNGMVSYLYAGDTQDFHSAADTISIADITAPVNTQYGSGFSIKGLIHADGMILTDVGAYVYSGMDMTADPYMVSRESSLDVTSYQLAGSAVDKKLTFGSMKKGTYTYVIRATAINYYADLGQLSTWSITQTLHRNIFVVSENATKDYLQQCQRDVSLGTVVLTEETALRNLPCTLETSPGAVELTRMEAGMRVAVTGLYQNPQGDWWYETEYDGLNCYIFAGDTASFRPYDNRVTLSGAVAPRHNTKGRGFSIYGLITSDMIPLSTVGAYVYTGTDVDTAAYLASEVSNANVNSFELNKSDVDNGLTFGKLEAGSYTYMIKAYTVNHYADENQPSKEMQEYILHRNTFTVSDKVSCNHTYTENITQPATCISNGLNTYTCSKCGYCYTLQTFATGVHVMGQWEAVVEATCTAGGYEISRCTGCELTDSRILPATGHSYQAVVTPPQIGVQGYTTHTCSGCGDSYVDSYTDVTAKITKYNVTLGDDLRVNFYMEYDEAVAETAEVYVTLAGETQVLPMQDVVSVHVAAAQMNDLIEVRIVDGENASEATTYSVCEYARVVLEDESKSSYHHLVKQMLRYGAAAQSYFDYNADSLADQGIAGIAQVDMPANADQEMIVADKLSGIDFYGATLVFRNRIALRFYFTAKEDIAGYTFTVNGEEYQPIEKNGMYYIEIGDIMPQNLDKSITVMVDEGLSVTYSPMNYMVNMNQKGSQTMKALVKALYNYYLAAKALV